MHIPIRQASTSVSTVVQDQLGRRIRGILAGQPGIPVEIRVWGNHVYRFGEGAPVVRIQVHDRVGLRALHRLDEVAICEAYMAGNLDVTGDMLGFVGLRGGLRDRHPLDTLWRRLGPWLIGRFKSNRRAIATHYEFDNDFYLRFLDPTRCYSQAVFERDDESLETAQRRKLDFVIESCRLQPGDQVLDVGSGWGTFMEHAGRRGIRVTGLTLSRQSERFQEALIRRLGLSARVLNQDFLTYESSRPYDAIVVLGVMEHLPNYAAVLRQFQRLLKPGGRVYLDASAFRDKYVKPTFVTRHIFPADHSFFCLHDFLAALARTPMDMLAAYNDRHSYFLTCKAWAENLDAARDDIIERWGEPLYRRFRLYLWGSAHAFLNRGMDAYRLVLERPDMALGDCAR